MKRLRGTVSYVGSSGRPTLTSEYEFTPAEAEAVALLEILKAEVDEVSERIFVSLHALSVLSRPDPVFVEYLTQGMCSITDGRITACRVEMQAVLDRFDGWWSHPWYHVSDMSPVAPSSHCEN